MEASSVPCEGTAVIQVGGGPKSTLRHDAAKQAAKAYLELGGKNRVCGVHYMHGRSDICAVEYTKDGCQGLLLLYLDREGQISTAPPKQISPDHRFGRRLFWRLDSEKQTISVRFNLEQRLKGKQTMTIGEGHLVLGIGQLAQA